MITPNFMIKKRSSFIILLSTLSDFCLNKIVFTNPENKFGEPNFYRQRALREMYIIDFLIDTLKLEVSEIESFNFFKKNLQVFEQADKVEIELKNINKKKEAEKKTNSILFPFLNRNKSPSIEITANITKKNEKPFASMFRNKMKFSTKNNKTNLKKFEVLKKVFKIFEIICLKNYKNQKYLLDKSHQILYYVDLN